MTHTRGLVALLIITNLKYRRRTAASKLQSGESTCSGPHCARDGFGFSGVSTGASRVGFG